MAKQFSTGAWQQVRNRVEEFEAQIDSRIDTYVSLASYQKKAWIDKDPLLAKAKELVKKWSVLEDD